MGRGIAVVFAYAGHRRRWSTSSRATRRRCQARGRRRLDEVRGTLDKPRRASACLIDGQGRPHRGARGGRARSEARAALSSAAVIFEGVPEVLDLKREALARASALAGPTADHRLDHIDDPGRRSLGRRRRIRSASSTRTGSIRPISCRWSSCRPARAPIPQSRRGSRRCSKASARCRSSARRGPATSCRASRRSP